MLSLVLEDSAWSTVIALRKTTRFSSVSLLHAKSDWCFGKQEKTSEDKQQKKADDNETQLSAGQSEVAQQTNRHRRKRVRRKQAKLLAARGEGLKRFHTNSTAAAACCSRSSPPLPARRLGAKLRLRRWSRENKTRQQRDREKRAEITAPIPAKSRRQGTPSTFPFHSADYFVRLLPPFTSFALSFLGFLFVFHLIRFWQP